MLLQEVLNWFHDLFGRNIRIDIPAPCKSVVEYIRGAEERNNITDEDTDASRESSLQRRPDSSTDDHRHEDT